MRFSFAPEILRCIYGYNHGDSSRYPLAVIIRLFDMPVRLFIYYCRKLKTYGLRYMRSVIDYLHALTFFVAHAEVYFQIQILRLYLLQDLHLTQFYRLPAVRVPNRGVFHSSYSDYLYQSLGLPEYQIAYSISALSSESYPHFSMILVLLYLSCLSNTMWHPSSTPISLAGRFPHPPFV